ncbi:amidohydrolase family protein [Frankia sp. CNm7]|uniref:Amidohydrolase family protein n=1 Tax=Frankia nepalensis TaxID=1836974 RepID=A0A937RPK0_9ACTN|nr:amidohydrolase family protein [Frankia nepalensis]MBL7500611.1 amidohydrolase family protein [Frankia nepalensis]MBL7510988.1 amidohydrolase family protein [Frankia nepalensis]MBL7518487.1 amidohydrolase family protein [Frankia nepalensis]MBL7630293.1 amidohydrolase family protein [Frankia nepalensis]
MTYATARPGQLPPREEVLVRAAWVLTVGPAGDLAYGAVHVRDGEIVAVGPYPELRADLPDVPVVGDGTGLLIPGFVNAHTHLSEALTTGMGSELTLFEWGERIVGPLGSVLTIEDACEGTRLRAVELLLTGVTTVNDMFVHSNPDEFASLGVVDGLVSAGLRGVVSFGAEDAAVPGAPWAGAARILAEQDELAVAVTAAAASGAPIGFRYGVGTLLGQSDELLEAGVDACRSHGWAVHTHLAEVREELVTASARWGRRTIPHALGLGMFDRPLIAGHGVWVTESDIDILASHDVAIAHNPVANMILGSGVCPVPRLRAAGLAVGIGTDGAASNDSQDMLQAVKMAALLAKVHALDPSVLDAATVLRMATLDGARALGLDHLVGSLEPGKRADLVLLQDSVCVSVLHDPCGQLVYGASPRAVRDVWVDGRRLVADHACVVIDEREQVERARPLASRLAYASGLADAGISRLRPPGRSAGRRVDDVATDAVAPDAGERSAPS